MSYDDPNSFIMGGGVPSISWKHAPVGTTVSGPITAPPQTRAVTDYYTKEPRFFKNGDPMKQSVIRFKTALRDSDKPQDDGERALYVKGQNIRALADAIRKAGAQGVEVGGWLSATFVREEPTEGEPRKVLEFVYQPPAEGSVEAPAETWANSTANRPPQAAQPASQGATQAVQLTPAQIAMLEKLGGMNPTPPFS